MCQLSACHSATQPIKKIFSLQHDSPPYLLLIKRQGQLLGWRFQTGGDFLLPKKIGCDFLLPKKNWRWFGVAKKEILLGCEKKLEVIFCCQKRNWCWNPPDQHPFPSASGIATPGTRLVEISWLPDKMISVIPIWTSQMTEKCCTAIC